MTKQAWSAYLADSALQVDYSSVKKNVIPANDDLRRDAYYQVWEAIYRWREKMDAHEKNRPRSEKNAGIRLPVRWKP